MKHLILTLALFTSFSAHADDVFRIEIGKDFKSYSNEDLQRRVWELERAVAQLQSRVFQLEEKPAQAASTPAPDSWSCTVKAMGEDFVGTGATKALATAAAVAACKKEKDGFFCKNPKCEQ